MLGAPSAQHLPFGTNLAANGGPRAPGNCSILCDSRRGDMKELLNAQIKRREPFRRFVSSVVEEAVSQ